MNAITCQEVQEQLDLLAAGECDRPTQEALESHLQQCQACAATYAESRRVLGLLDLHLRQDGLERLQQRIEEEAQPRRKRRSFTPLIGGFSLVAALILIAVGLIWWLPKEGNDRKGAGPEFALLVRAGQAKLEIAPPLPAPRNAKDPEAVAVMALAERDGVALRRELLQAQRGGKLPLPPAVALELVLVNTGKHAVEVRLGDAAAHLSLELAGDGVLRIAAPDADTPEPLREQTLQLEPGKELILRIDRLVAGSPGKLEYIYLTEPGEFMLTPRLQLTAAGLPATVTGKAKRIQVGNQPAVLP
jgi:Putative zinc-finger